MPTGKHQTTKEENRRSGFVFIAIQAALLVLSAVTYFSLHCVFPAWRTFPTGSELVKLDAYGRATVISAEDVDWYVGATKGVPLLAQMDQRNKSIESRAGNLQTKLQDLASRYSEDAAASIRNAVDGGDFNTAIKRLAVFHESLSPASQANGGDALLIQVEETLRELDELKQDQLDSLDLLTPPKKFIMFWATPWGILAEVVAWSLFGLFSSLLYHSARYARRDKFKRAEVYVGVTKMFYTPVVAVVLILAVTVGVLQVGTIVTRIWMIPLFGFLAGFSSRKAAKLVDGLAEWVLGRMARSLQGQNNDAAKAGVNAIQQALLPPATFNDIATQAKQMADAKLADAFNKLAKT